MDVHVLFLRMEGVVYLIGMLQFLIALCVVLFCGDVETGVYGYTPHWNSSSVGDGAFREWRFSMSIPVAMCSFLASLFVSVTFSLDENGAFARDEAYSMEALKQTGMWNILFWFFVVVVHFICFMCLMTPCDIYCILLVTFTSGVFLMSICAPILGEERNLMKNNVGVGGVFFAYLVVMYNIPVYGSNRYGIMLILFLFDYFLCIGHTWDLSTQMLTVANCRVCYCCAAPVCVTCLYALWRDKLLFNAVSPMYEQH